MPAPVLAAAASFVGIAIANAVKSAIEKGAEFVVVLQILALDDVLPVLLPVSETMRALAERYIDALKLNPILNQKMKEAIPRSIIGRFMFLWHISQGTIQNIQSKGLDITFERFFQDLRRSELPFPLDFATLQRAEIVDRANKERVDEIANKTGIEPISRALLRDAVKPLASPGDIRDFIFRTGGKKFELDPTKRPTQLEIEPVFAGKAQMFATWLRRLGYPEEDIEVLIHIMDTIPGIQDVIRFAVREAFTPEVVKKFELDEDLPSLFLQEAERRGLSKQDATFYWRAHWELPSATQGFEMLHRGIIDEKDLELLLRTLDVMPFWRKKLIQLSFVPFTRVDIRRMFREGVLTEQDVIRAYKDIGYNDQKARKLAEFTFKEAFAAFRNSLIAELEKLFLAGIIDDSTLKERMKALKVSDTQINFSVAEITLRRKREFINDIIKLVEKEFIEGIIDEKEYNAAIAGFNLTPNVQSEIIRLAKEKKLLDRRSFTFADIKRFRQDGILQDKEFLDLAKRLNIDASFALLELQDIKLRLRLKDERDLTKGEILSAFRTKAIDEPTLLMHLKRLGFDDAESALIISVEKMKLAVNSQKEQININNRMFVEGLLTEDIYRANLIKLGVPKEQVALLVQENLDKRKAELKQLNPNELDEMLIRGIIKLDNYKKAMEQLNFSINVIDLKIELNRQIAFERQIKRSKEEAKELEKLFKEAQKRTQELIELGVED